MVYINTFTLTAPGPVVMTFNTRPQEIDYDPQTLIAEEKIPGGDSTVVQNLGHGGWRVAFKTLPWNVTGITLAAAVDARDIVEQLVAWFRAGTVLEFYSDFIDGVNAGDPIDVKMMKGQIKELPGIARNYMVDIVLQEYVAGSAI